MIVREFYTTREDGVNLYRTYSDENLHIHKIGTNEVYSEAIDVEDASYEYAEADIPIELPEAIADGDTNKDKDELAI